MGAKGGYALDCAGVSSAGSIARPRGEAPLGGFWTCIAGITAAHALGSRSGTWSNFTPGVSAGQ